MNSRDELLVTLAHLANVIDQRIAEHVAALGPEPIPTGEYITIREAAGKLNVHTSTVRRWLTSGYLPGTKVSGGRSGNWRIRRADLDAVDPTSQPLSTPATTEDGPFPSSV